MLDGSFSTLVLMLILYFIIDWFIYDKIRDFLIDWAHIPNNMAATMLAHAFAVFMAGVLCGVLDIWIRRII